RLGADDHVVGDHRGTKIVVDGAFSFPLPAAEDSIFAARKDVISYGHVRLLQHIEHQRGTRGEARVMVERDIAWGVDQLPEPSAGSQLRCTDAVEQIVLDKNVVRHLDSVVTART